MSATAQLPLLGRIAVQLKMITQEQLAQATRRQADEGGTKNIGQVLCEMGFLKQPQLAQLLKARDQLVAKQKAMQAVAGADARPEVGAGQTRAPAVARTQATPVSGAGAAAKPDAPAAAARPAQRTPAQRGADHLQRVAPRSFAAALGGVDPDELHKLLRLGVERGASDVHVHAGQPLRLRLHGKFVAANDDVIDAVRSERLVFSALDPEQTKIFRERGELDLAYAGARRRPLPRERSTASSAASTACSASSRRSRRRSTELGLPSSLARFTNFHQGLVLVTGPAGCGKSVDARGARAT